MNALKHNPNRNLNLRACAATLALAGLFALTGCGMSVSTTSGGGDPVTPAAHVSGRVFGGQQPIIGANIQLYAVNPTTLRGPSTPLITSKSIKTDSAGSFDISGDYTCPANALTYIVATGGDAGAGPNAKIVLMSGLGPCSLVPALPYIEINEVTTVATAYALQPFMADYLDAGAPTSTGITNAFALINDLVDVTAGTAPGPSLPTGASVNTAELNTLGNILASCVNSNGGSNCTQLLTTAVNANGTAATDVSAAALNIAARPAVAVSTLFGFSSATPPFVPTLTSAPNDWTVAITLTGSGIKSPWNIAIDALGNAWITNTASNAITKLSPTGAPLSGTTGFTSVGLLGPQGIAIDTSNRAWIANTGGDSVLELSPSGTLLSTFTTGGISAPIAIALDKAGDAWVANFSGNSVTELIGGAPSGASPLTLNGLLSAPTGIAIDPAGNIWAASGGNGTLVAFTSAGTVKTGAGLTDGLLQGTAQLAIDTTGTAWATAPGLNALTAINSTFAPIPGSPDFNGSLSLPLGVAIDGGNNIWVTSATGNSISELAAATGATIPGSTFIGSVTTPVGIAIDASGNVWTANSGSDSVSILIGIATPAIVPLQANLP
jgi:streptogramin lyase